MQWRSWISREGRAALDVPRALLAAGFLALTVAYLVSSTAYVSGVPFQFDDWEWLWWGQSADRFLELLTANREMLRPVPWALYGVFQWLFGLEPVAMGVFFLAVAVTASVLLVRVFHAVGFPLPVAVFSALLSWSSAATTTSLTMLSLNETTLARALAAVLWLQFLSRKEPSSSRWGPVFAVGLLCHEQFLMAPAMLALLFWYRDGWVGLRERWMQSPAFRGLWWATAAFGAVRVVLFLLADRSTHELDPQALGRNLSYVARHLTLLPLSGLEALDGWAWPAGGALVLLALWRGVRARKAGATWRLAVFLLGWVALACAPFLLSRDYVAVYFLNLAIHAPALALGTLLVGALTDGRRSTGSRLALVAMGLVALPWQPDLKVQRTTATRILKVIGPQIGPPGAPDTPVIFVEDTPSLTAGDEPYLRRENIAPYLATISAEWRNYALEVLHPGRSFPVAVLEDDEAWLLCARPDDVLVYVEALPEFHSRWHFSPLREDSPLHGRVPPTLIPGLPSHARTLYELKRGSSHPAARHLAHTVLGDYAKFCHARLAGDEDAETRAARRVVETAPLLDTPAAEDLLAALEAVWTPPFEHHHR